MSEPVIFLQALARAATAVSLYHRDHPAAARAIESAFGSIPRDGHTSAAAFTFLGEDVLCGATSVRPLRGWAWASRLANLGIQRLEIDPEVTRAEFCAFLDDLAARLGGAPSEDPESIPNRTHVRVGSVTISQDTEPTADNEVRSGILLTDELDVMQWLLDEVTVRGAIPFVEAQSVVSALAVLMHGDARLALPQLPPDDAAQALASHALNVSVLAMALAESSGYAGRDVRGVGLAALLHDVGKARLPRELFDPALQPAAAEQATIETHPVEGARVLLRSDGRFDLAAVVAYEHHMTGGAAGYPRSAARRELHWTTRLVRVADAFDRLQWLPAHRDAPTPESVISALQADADLALDGSMLAALSATVRHTRPQRVSVAAGRV